MIAAHRETAPHPAVVAQRVIGNRALGSALRAHRAPVAQLESTRTVYAKPGDGPGSASGTKTASGTSPRCRVKRFGMTFDAWNVSWPWTKTGNTTIRLPVDFAIELEPGSKRGDCRIGQEKRGRVEHGGTPSEFSSWTSDSGLGFVDWWDGERWKAGLGSWEWNPNDWFNEAASFEDEPGFNSVPRSDYPLYWGGVGRKGHFEFRTYIKDKRTSATIRTLTWGMLMDYSAPKSGRRYFYR